MLEQRSISRKGVEGIKPPVISHVPKMQKNPDREKVKGEAKRQSSRKNRPERVQQAKAATQVVIRMILASSEWTDLAPALHSH